jgi:hypothetical protein
MRTVLKSAALSVALAAMVLRAVLPIGWMPSAEAGAPLMLCPGADPAVAVQPMPGMDMPKAPAPKHAPTLGTYCVCAAAAPLSAPVSDQPQLVPQIAPRSVVLAQAHEAPARTSAFRPNAPRGPPVSPA